MPLLNSWVAVTRKEGRRIRGLPRPKYEVSGAQHGLSQTSEAPRCHMWMGKSRHERQSYRQGGIAHETLGSPGQYGAKLDAAKLAFVRICTHYFAHGAWLEDGQLIRDAHRLRGIPGVLIHGRLDLSGPLLTAWELAQAWPDVQLTIIEDSGHSGSPAVGTAVRNAIARFDSTDSHL